MAKDAPRAPLDASFDDFGIEVDERLRRGAHSDLRGTRGLRAVGGFLPVGMMEGLAGFWAAGPLRRFEYENDHLGFADARPDSFLIDAGDGEAMGFFFCFISCRMATKRDPDVGEGCEPGPSTANPDEAPLILYPTMPVVAAPGPFLR